MFNQIAGRYDFLNWLLSFGLDKYWRKNLVKEIKIKKDTFILDLATGTGDVLIEIFKKDSSIKKAVGIDISSNMLEIAKNKISRPNIQFILMDAKDIGQLNIQFDVITVAFGIRNMESLEEVLKSVYDALKIEGKFIILEFGLPKNNLLKAVYLFYFRRVLPFLGGLFSGNKKAYSYLNQSVENFLDEKIFFDFLKKTGFSRVKINKMTFGIANIFICEKNEC